MEIGNIIPHIEALIFASDKPLTSMEITELVNNAFGFMEEKLTLEQIQTSIDGIREKYDSEFYPFEVRESGGGWQFLTKKDFHKTIAQLNGEKFLKRLSSAALETLSIIAYKQPITKGEIEAIRGVSSDYSIQKLLEKELILISGRNEDMPGKPLVYATSKTFMDYFGINSAADLPKLKEIFAETLIEPTVIIHSAGELQPDTEINGPQDEEVSPLIVTETGELIISAEDQTAGSTASDAEPDTTNAASESDTDSITGSEPDADIETGSDPDTASSDADAPDAGSDIDPASDPDTDSDTPFESDEPASSGDEELADEEEEEHFKEEEEKEEEYGHSQSADDDDDDDDDAEGEDDEEDPEKEEDPNS